MAFMLADPVSGSTNNVWNCHWQPSCIVQSARTHSDLPECGRYTVACVCGWHVYRSQQGPNFPTGIGIPDGFDLASTRGMGTAAFLKTKKKKTLKEPKGWPQRLRLGLELDQSSKMTCIKCEWKTNKTNVCACVCDEPGLHSSCVITGHLFALVIYYYYCVMKERQTLNTH